MTETVLDLQDIANLRQLLDGDAAAGGLATGVALTARLMRERAKAATKGTWGVSSTEILAGMVRDREVVSYDRCIAEVKELGRGGMGGSPEDANADDDAAHIAAMANPAVALALADWMEDCADRFRRGLVIAVATNAVEVARAYLAADIEEG